MEITQQIRDYTEKLGLDAESAKEKGMEVMFDEFRSKGGDLSSVTSRVGL